MIRHVMSRLLVPLLLACSLGAAAPAAVAPLPQTAAATSRSQHEAPRARQAWWAEHRWRYRDEAETEVAYRALTQRQSPWPEWHQSHVVVLQPGTRFQMALSPGQAPDRPGGFGTLDFIPDVAFVRERLAVKREWKPEIDRVATYEIVAPLLVDLGVVGPQIDVSADLYLRGGGSQFQMLVPPPERISHVRLVEVRTID